MSSTHSWSVSWGPAQVVCWAAPPAGAACRAAAINRSGSSEGAQVPTLQALGTCCRSPSATLASAEPRVLSVCLQERLPKSGVGGDVQWPHRTPAEGPHLPEPHLLPAPEAHGGRQNSLKRAGSGADPDTAACGGASPVRGAWCRGPCLSVALRLWPARLPVEVLCAVARHVPCWESLVAGGPGG